MVPSVRNAVLNGRLDREYLCLVELWQSGQVEIEEVIRIGPYTEEERQFFKKQITALYPEMYRYVRAQLNPLNKGMAEDLVQIACRKAWESFHTLKDRKNFRGWIFRILKNTRNEYYRKVFRESEILFFSDDPEGEAKKERNRRHDHNRGQARDQDTDHTETRDHNDNHHDNYRRKHDTYLYNELLVEKDILETLIEEENHQRLMDAFDRLNKQEQQLLKLWLIGGCSEKELAEIYGINYNTLRSRIHRGLRRWRTIYQELDRGDEDE